jgi:hypothetical protein
MSSITRPFDFSEIVGYPNYIPEDVVDNVFGFHEGGDACAHIKAFGNLIDDWDDTPIHEDALMSCFLGLFWRTKEVLVIGFLCMMINQSRTFGTFCMTFWKDLGMIRMKFTVSWLMILWENGRGKIFQI